MFKQIRGIVETILRLRKYRGDAYPLHFYQSWKIAFIMSKVDLNSKYLQCYRFNLIYMPIQMDRDPRGFFLWLFLAHKEINEC